MVFHGKIREVVLESDIACPVCGSREFILRDAGKFNMADMICGKKDRPGTWRNVCGHKTVKCRICGHEEGSMIFE